MKEYLYWNHKLKIVKYPGNIINLSIDMDKKNRHVMKEDVQQYRINETAAEIIKLVNGKNTYDDIVVLLCAKYGEDSVSIKKKLDGFIDTISKQFGLKIITQHEPKERNVAEMNKKVVSPMVASIEITNKCNIRCVHCYGNFGEIPCEVMDKENIKKILSDLRKIGVRIIEITGGEATTHPYIEEIMDYALALNFDQVSLLTNGVKISDRLMEILEKNKDKVYVQVDLHSLREDYFSWFTKTPNILEKVKRNIITLAEKRILLRVATILTPKNIDEIDEIADWVHNLGVARYAVSPVVSLGRANDQDRNSQLYLDANDAIKAEKQLQKIVSKYDNFLNIITSDFDKQINCGCITSHVVINSKGYIKICTMDDMSYCNGCIGNVLEENIEHIFERNAELLNVIYTTKAPKMNSDECRECENAGYCNGCLLRGIIKAKEKKEQCLWYKNIVPQIIKEAFDI
ncbi:MAG TPA: PqqD family peptide modification chaperone [Candidatus Anaerostipes avistercoris]|uniref:PqqD family peptide modification chaperone n=1 Tax=Candidatus Anaerostipes avistercoris TaxID=2838462 RepID=A0A9D2PEM5_9FIRM|nr:PqqD family peptide modification chaperone [Candidatus Anaerostipes avistercoris]